jgi:hypothetical protein
MDVWDYMDWLFETGRLTKEEYDDLWERVLKAVVDN